MRYALPGSIAVHIGAMALAYLVVEFPEPPRPSDVKPVSVDIVRTSLATGEAADSVELETPEIIEDAALEAADPLEPSLLVPSEVEVASADPVAADPVPVVSGTTGALVEPQTAEEAVIETAEIVSPDEPTPEAQATDDVEEARIDAVIEAPATLTPETIAEASIAPIEVDGAGTVTPETADVIETLVADPVATALPDAVEPVEIAGIATIEAPEVQTVLIPDAVDPTPAETAIADATTGALDPLEADAVDIFIPDLVALNDVDPLTEVPADRLESETSPVAVTQSATSIAPDAAPEALIGPISSIEPNAIDLRADPTAVETVAASEAALAETIAAAEIEDLTAPVDARLDTVAEIAGDTTAVAEPLGPQGVEADQPAQTAVLADVPVVRENETVPEARTGEVGNATVLESGAVELDGPEIAVVATNAADVSVERPADAVETEPVAEVAADPTNIAPAAETTTTAVISPDAVTSIEIEEQFLPDEAELEAERLRVAWIQNRYYEMVQAAINHARQYPAAANGATGAVEVQFTVLANGMATGLVVTRKSGNPLLDEAAIEAIKRAQPLPEIPAEVGGDTKTFTIKVDFSPIL